MRTARTRQTFSARIILAGEGSAWPILPVPFDVEKVFGTRGRVSVRGTLNGFEYRSSIFPNPGGAPGHHMMVNKTMLEGAKAAPGDAVKVVMERDDQLREVEVPDDLAKALRKDPAAMKNFDALSPSARRSFADWVASGKQEATRRRRVEQAVADIAAGKKRRG
jgi:hypothetical protein